MFIAVLIFSATSLSSYAASCVGFPDECLDYGSSAAFEETRDQGFWCRWDRRLVRKACACSHSSICVWLWYQIVSFGIELPELISSADSRP